MRSQKETEVTKLRSRQWTRVARHFGLRGFITAFLYSVEVLKDPSITFAFQNHSRERKESGNQLPQSKGRGNRRAKRTSFPSLSSVPILLYTGAHATHDVPHLRCSIAGTLASCSAGGNSNNTSSPSTFTGYVRME